MHPQTTLKIDQVLDELDSLVRSSISDEEFYSRLMSQCLVTVNASSIAFAMPAVEGCWIVRAALGNVDPQLADSLQRTVKVPADLLTTGQPLMGETASGHWYAVPVSSACAAKGLLVVGYADALSDTDRRGLFEIQRAFCELVNERQSIAMDRFFASDFVKIDEICNCLEDKESIVSAGQTLVNGIASILSNCRVSLTEVASNGAVNPLAVSAVSKFDRKGVVFRQIQSLAQLAIAHKSAIVCRRVDDGEQDGVQLNVPGSDTVFLPLRQSGGDIRWVIGFEFSDQQAFVNGSSKLPFFLPTLGTIWKQKVVWLDVPSWIRKIPFANSKLRISLANLTRPIVFTAVLVVFGIWMLMPKTLLVEAEGAILPSESMAIFTAADGFVSSLLVSEKQYVEAGQLLASITSPNLELQLEEIRGKIRTLDEEFRGLNIAMNQLEPNAGDLLKQQSLMALKLREITIQLQSLQKQKSIVEGQKTSLEIRSPIEGVVVGKDLQQNLLGRPVNRGELLFRVMNLSSDWELRLNVADQDSNYVLETYFRDRSSNNRKIEFLIDSSPKERKIATIKSFANRVENVNREGNYFEVRADIEDISEDSKKIGSNVHAYFDCGQFPTWYVWFRPAIDAARRKLWL